MRHSIFLLLRARGDRVACMGAGVRDGAATGAAESGGGIAVIGHVPLVGGPGGSSTGYLDRLLDAAVQEAVTSAAARLVAAAPRISANGTRAR